MRDNTCLVLQTQSKLMAREVTGHVGKLQLNKYIVKQLSKYSCLCPRLVQILALIREASFDSGQWSKCRLITQQSIENKGCRAFNLKMEHLCHSLLGPGDIMKEGVVERL